MNTASDRRISERIFLSPHLSAFMTPISTCDSSVKESSLVCILDIGIDGLKFKSNSDLEVTTEVIFALEILTKSLHFVVQGQIVYRTRRNDAWEYGVELYMNDDETDSFLDFLETIIHERAPELGSFAYPTCQCTHE